MPKPSSTQLGSIAENLVANALMIESNGRLSPFIPHADDDGIDLLIYDKESGKALPAQIKSRTVTLKKKGSAERGNSVHFEVRRATYKVERYAAAIFILTSENGYRVDCAWVVPMKDLPTVARSTEKKFVLRPSKSVSSKDRFSMFRCDTPAYLHQRVVALLAEAP